jgi:hypothetical protein
LVTSQPQHDRQVRSPARPVPSRLVQDDRRGPDGNCDVERAADFGAEEFGRCDANDGHRDAIDRKRLADDVCSAAKAALPEAVTDHGDTAVRRTDDILGRSKAATAKKRDAQLLKEVPAHKQPVGRLPLAALGEVELLRKCGPREGAVEVLLALTYLVPDCVVPPG